jgi:uncharacterized protein (TIGR00255 family)
MTGFARADGRLGSQQWTWEVKSVNGRGLDVRFRLPPDCESIELPARQLVGERIKRGSVSINLRVGAQAAPLSYRINRDLLRELAALAREAQASLGAAPIRLDGLLAVRGVIEAIEAPKDEAETAAREAAMLQSFAEALDHLAAARAAEGGKIAQVLSALLDDIARLTAAARDSAAARPEALKARLRQQVAELLDASPRLPDERLAQEVALAVVKFDVREELDRLAAHGATAREVMHKSAAGAGRTLDFLSQEFSREANTLCAKANDAALGRIGMDLRLAIDRFREQVQNIE